MSDKLDFITYLKSTLTAASAKLLASNPTDRATAGRLDQIVRTAENISDGYWLRIAPAYQSPWPIAAELLRSVSQLNASIIAGQSVANFDAYIALLVAALGTTPAKRYPQPSD
ncbi:hypothetical protein QCM80_09330 [Bradyrhizobium sp. SSUT112]|uniref:hypothetical protein n=1 Tax=Bradyrhizobium sp. SSUT112 TaxID=3040604 RepID=UPI002449799C|nr:hypothetical protein [Bradyrhizobium sp. SSUT112]MDH2350868.1 hypothetical protein [Bradyrhizobium sp. SSUT112]